jgi:hypothetical protein
MARTRGQSGANSRGRLIALSASGASTANFGRRRFLDQDSAKNKADSLRERGRNQKADALEHVYVRPPT